MLNPMLVTALIVTGEERRGCCSFERSTEKKNNAQAQLKPWFKLEFVFELNFGLLGRSDGQQVYTGTGA